MPGSMVLQKSALRINCTFQLDIRAAFSGSQSSPHHNQGTTISKKRKMKQKQEHEGDGNREGDGGNDKGIASFWSSLWRTLFAVLAVITSPPRAAALQLSRSWHSNQCRTLSQSQPHPAALSDLTGHSLFPHVRGGKRRYGKDAGYPYRHSKLATSIAEHTRTTQKT